MTHLMLYSEIVVVSKIQAHILDGRKIAEKELAACKSQIQKLKSSGSEITLATIRAGEAKDAILYFNYLKKLIAEIGIELKSFEFPESVTEKQLTDAIQKLNNDHKITAIMVFSPLPKKCDPAKVFDFISTLKDAEGRTFLKSHFGVFSPTAHAVMTLIEATGENITGKEAVVVGHSDLVGKPVAVLLMDKMATVTVCHKETRDLKKHIEHADIVVSAAGKANLIPGSWIKQGAIVVDVGENMVAGKLLGDVEFESAQNRASHITPVPGGVGPVTNVMLIKNLIRLKNLQDARNGNS